MHRLVGSKGMANFLGISDTRVRMLVLTDPTFLKPKFIVVENGRMMWDEQEAMEFAKIRVPRPALGRPRKNQRKE